MSINVENLITGTHQLIEQIDVTDEYQVRNACGRAYYTLFHTTLFYLDAKHNYSNVLTSGAYNNMGTHERLTTFLEDHINIPNRNTNKNYQRLIFMLVASKKLRTDADYLLNKNMETIQLKQATDNLNNGLKLIEEFKKEI